MAEYYDVFISHKTEDVGMAKELYDFLVSKGLNVFLSEMTLSAVGQARYKKTIDNALEASEHMIVVGSREEYIKSQWVEYEWDTFINELLAGRKQGNIVTVIGKGLSVAQLPISLRQYEALPFSGDEFKRVYNYVSKKPIDTLVVKHFELESRVKTLVEERLNQIYSNITQWVNTLDIKSRFELLNPKQSIQNICHEITEKFLEKYHTEQKLWCKNSLEPFLREIISDIRSTLNSQSNDTVNSLNEGFLGQTFASINSRFVPLAMISSIAPALLSSILSILTFSRRELSFSKIKEEVARIVKEKFKEMKQAMVDQIVKEIIAIVEGMVQERGIVLEKKLFPDHLNKEV